MKIESTCAAVQTQSVATEEAAEEEEHLSKEELTEGAEPPRWIKTHQ